MFVDDTTPVHQDAIEESSCAVEDAAHGSDKREEVVVRDEALAKRFVKTGHRLGDQHRAKPESVS